MKLYKFSLVLLSVVMMGLFSSCRDDSDYGPKVAKAVLVSAPTLQYEGVGSDPQTITVYSDAQWVADVPEWVTISPETGSGVTDVTVSVSDNLRGGALDNPRKALLVFRGDLKMSYYNVTIRQSGDNYRDCPTLVAKDIVTAADETYFDAKNLLVAGKFDGGYIVTDDNGANNLFVATDKAAAVGDKINIRAQKMTDDRGLAMANAEEFSVVSTGNAVNYPTPVDITANIDKYTGTARTYVMVSGILNGETLTIDGATNKVTPIKNINIDLSGLNGHFVDFIGYFAGVAAPFVNLEVIQAVDNGEAQLVYFSDDFEWLEPWTSITPAGRTIETDDLDATAQQLATNKVDGISTYQALMNKGYGFPVTCAAGKAARNGGSQNYVQRNYIKFGLTGYYSGLTLPKLTTEPAADAAVIIAFDWCTMRQGSGTMDPTKLVVVVKNGSDEVQFEVPEHGLASGSALRWIHVEIPVEGVTIDKNTEITIRNCDAQWPADGSALRWFVDNIKLFSRLY